MTYQITNVIAEDSNIRVFYVFDNGEENSAVFPATANFLTIQKWATDRIALFEAQAIALNEKVEELQVIINE